MCTDNDCKDQFVSKIKVPTLSSGGGELLQDTYHRGGKAETIQFNVITTAAVCVGTFAVKFWLVLSEKPKYHLLLESLNVWKYFTWWRASYRIYRESLQFRDDADDHLLDKYRLLRCHYL